MCKRKYQKAPKSFKQQLQLLKERKLIVGDNRKALEYLYYINYYRLSAYFLPYQQEKDRFDEGTTFKQIIDTYSFDRELRLLVFDCIERIEVAIRTQFIYCMSMHYKDSHWQDNKDLFVKYKDNNGNLKDPYSYLQKNMFQFINKNQSEGFIKHYIDTYNNPVNPPSWMYFELLTIGNLSYTYNGLKNKSDKKRIAEKFGLHYTVFSSWLHSLTYVRNICAHHTRLWNRKLAVEPGRLLKPKNDWISSAYSNNKRLFYFICLLKYFLSRVNPNNSLKEKLQILFKKYPTVPIKYIGIPSDVNGNLLQWYNEPLWQERNRNK